MLKFLTYNSQNIFIGIFIAIFVISVFLFDGATLEILIVGVLIIITPIIIFKLIIQAIHHNHFEVKGPMQVEIRDGFINHKALNKDARERRLEWKLNIDDILLITCSHAHYYSVKFGESYWKTDSKGRRRKYSQAKNAVSYKFLHFFDSNENQYLLDLFSDLTGTGALYLFLEEKFDITRDLIEQVGGESKLLYPTPSNSTEPHAAAWLEDRHTFRAGIRNFFRVTHPNHGILKQEILTFSREVKLIREIGSQNQNQQNQYRDGI